MHPIVLEFVFEEFNQYINANLDGQSIYYPILHLAQKEEKKEEKRTRKKRKEVTLTLGLIANIIKLVFINPTKN